MSELLSSIQRAQDLLSNGGREGISIILVLDAVHNHAVSAEKLIAAQAKSMTEMHLKIKELTADLSMHKERMDYWERRARSLEEDARNIIPSTFKAWWAMVEAECDIQQEPLEDSAIALNYMGNGASCHVTVGEIRDMLGCKTDDTMQELRAHGLEDHLAGGDQDA